MVFFHLRNRKRWMLIVDTSISTPLKGTVILGECLRQKLESLEASTSDISLLRLFILLQPLQSQQIHSFMQLGCHLSSSSLDATFPHCSRLKFKLSISKLHRTTRSIVRRSRRDHGWIMGFRRFKKLQIPTSKFRSRSESQEFWRALSKVRKEWSQTDSRQCS